MSLIRPFAGLRPRSELAEQVLAPPYDVLSTEEARAFAASRPLSFLHISKPEIDLPPATDPYSPEVYAKGKENFQRLLAEGALARDPVPYYYLYRLIMGDHAQTGIVAAASVADYVGNRIRKHEFTRPDKEDDRVRQIDALNAQTGPVFLTYRHSAKIDEIVSVATAAPPDIDVQPASLPGMAQNVRHSLWTVRDPVFVEALTRLFDGLDYLYVADGHHRSAAAARVAALRRAANPRHTGNEPYNYFLSVIFPDSQMQILDYNRVVRDLNGLSPEAFIERVQSAFSIKKSATPVKPAKAGAFGMYLAGQWYELAIHPERMPQDDPVRRLDVSLLADHLLAPVLDIHDPRRDKRIDFVGGVRGLPELVRRVDGGEMAVAFSLFPTSLSQLMAVADAGAVMPPKSTWFEPKLADGMVSHLLD